MRRSSPLIVGGGPAGATAAILLAQGGAAPLLIERQREIGDALCGGFLSWTTMAMLERLGVDVMGLGAHRVTKLVLLAGHRRAEAALPRPAAGLSRHTLDTALLARARAEGAAVDLGVTVRAFEGGGMRTQDGGCHDAAATILAVGKHDLRGAPRTAGGDDPAIGLRWRLGASSALRRLIDEAIELHLFPGGYAGLVMQEESANLCLAIRRSAFAACDGKPDRLLAWLIDRAPALAMRIDAADVLSSFQAIANIPYGWRATGSADGLYRIGDQAGVIPSLAGEGIAIALASGRAAATAVLAGLPAADFQRQLAAGLRRPIGLARLLWRGAEHPMGAHAMIAGVASLPALANWAARATRVGPL